MKLLAFLLLPIFSFSQIIVDQKISMLENKVELLIPKEFSKMTDEVWKKKYRTAEKPTVVYSDNLGEANLIGNMTDQVWEEENLATYRDFRIENLKKSRTDVKILETGIKDVSGKKVAFFKFMTQAIDTKIFNYYFFVMVDNKVLMFTLNYPWKLIESWDKVGDEIIASIRIK